MLRSQNEILKQLTDGIDATETTIRPDGSAYRVWRGFAAGNSKGAGAVTHHVTITHDTFRGGSAYGARASCMGRFGSSITSEIVRAEPTCKRCRKAQGLD